MEMYMVYVQGGKFTCGLATFERLECIWDLGELLVYRRYTHHSEFLKYYGLYDDARIRAGRFCGFCKTGAGPLACLLPSSFQDDDLLKLVVPVLAEDQTPSWVSACR